MQTLDEFATEQGVGPINLSDFFDLHPEALEQIKVSSLRARVQADWLKTVYGYTVTPEALGSWLRRHP